MLIYSDSNIYRDKNNFQLSNFEPPQNFNIYKELSLDLKQLPRVVNNLDIQNSLIKDLSNIPFVLEALHISYSGLKSLYGLEQNEFYDYFSVTNNFLENLDYAPLFIKSIFDVKFNKIKSIKNLPLISKECNLTKNNIETFEELYERDATFFTGSFICVNNPLKNLNGIEKIKINDELSLTITTDIKDLCPLFLIETIGKIEINLMNDELNKKVKTFIDKFQIVFDLPPSERADILKKDLNKEIENILK